MSEETSIDYRYFSSSLLEAIPIPVFIIDRALRVQNFNRPGLNLSQVQPLAKGMTLDDIIPDPPVLQLVQECIQNDTPRRELYNKRGSDIFWRISITPLIHQAEDAANLQPIVSSPASSPEHQYFALVIEDMTEARRLERMQRDFIANVSHELRTPLTSVRLLAETLEDTIDTNPDKAQEFVEKIEKEVQYLSGLVAELLELSRIESGQTEMTIEPIGAAQLVREAMARMLPLAQRHRVKLGTDIQQGEILVAADSKQIMSTLVNLIHNAVKFTPSGGTITIGTALQANQHAQRFFVQDTGAGVSEQDLPRIFERFYKTDRARSKADYIGPGGVGTGLGLAIARNVVEAHSGHIWAESRVGEGSTFTFTLPVAIKTDLLPDTWPEKKVIAEG